MLQALLMYVVFPLWVGAGLADWWCHRRTAIETTTGLRESLTHIVLFGQMALGGLAILFLEINMAVLVLLSALFLSHELTTWLELRWVRGHRELRAGEQMVHSFLELLPLFVLLSLLALHLESSGPGRPAQPWQWQAKTTPLPPAYLLASCGAVFALNLLPLLEELRRCWRASR
jgi:hypothetical protein